MKIIRCEQGSPEWHQARAGVITASRAGDLVTPKTLARSASTGRYVAELAAERVLGRPLDDGGFMSTASDRGTRMELEALDWLSLVTGLDVQPVGFCVSDDGTFGASPDGVVLAPDGSVSIGVEVKVPMAGKHARNVLDTDAFVLEHRLQVQFGMLVTGAPKWILVSYHPIMTPYIVHVAADPAIAAVLRAAVKDVTAMISVAVDRLRAPLVGLDEDTRAAMALFG